jgi:hypothetical protein
MIIVRQSTESPVRMRAKLENWSITILDHAGPLRKGAAVQERSGNVRG